MSSVKPISALIRLMLICMLSFTTLFIFSLQIANAQLAEQGSSWRNWNTVGQAKLSWLFFDVYNSKLLSPSGVYQQTQDVSPHPIALNITYLRSISSEQLLEATDDQWEEIGIGTPELRKNWIAELGQSFSDVDDGDQLTYVTDGERGWLWFKPKNQPEQLRGTVEDEALNDAFLAIWLSPETNYPKLRSQLIKGN